jgi:hypothetical protein
MAACNFVLMYTDATPKSGSTWLRSGDRWRKETRAHDAGADLNACVTPIAGESRTQLLHTSI